MFKKRLTITFCSWARDNDNAKTTTRQRNRASGTRKYLKVSVSKWSSNNETDLWPEIMITLSRQCYRVPSTGIYAALNNILSVPRFVACPTRPQLWMFADSSRIVKSAAAREASTSASTRGNMWYRPSVACAQFLGRGINKILPLYLRPIMMTFSAPAHCYTLFIHINL